MRLREVSFRLKEDHIDSIFHPPVRIWGQWLQYESLPLGQVFASRKEVRCQPNDIAFPCCTNSA